VPWWRAGAAAYDYRNALKPTISDRTASAAGTRRRLVLAILISVLVHGVLLSLLPKPSEGPTPQPVLDVVLSPPRQGPEPEEPEAQTTELRAPEETAASEPIPEPARELEMPERVEPEPAPVREREVPRTVLNLERPTNWDDLIERTPEPDVKSTFNPDLKNRLVRRERQKRHQQLVQARVDAAYGVPDELYARAGPLGTEIKTDGRCYVLAANPAVEDGDRWWARRCTDTRTNPFRLAPIDADAIGRAVVD
jgi:hypothetical protein